jgi:hypothetical protein
LMGLVCEWIEMPWKGPVRVLDLKWFHQVKNGWGWSEPYQLSMQHRCKLAIPSTVSSIKMTAAQKCKQLASGPLVCVCFAISRTTLHISGCPNPGLQKSCWSTDCWWREGKLDITGSTGWRISGWKFFPFSDAVTGLPHPKGCSCAQYVLLCTSKASASMGFPNRYHLFEGKLYWYHYYSPSDSSTE